MSRATPIPNIFVAAGVLLLLSCSVILFVVVEASDGFPVVPFEEGYTQLFGDDNLVIHRDGNSVHLTLDERSGSGFVSHDLYLHGFFGASIKLPADYTAGVVVAFYMSNGDMYEKNHDEIDFEFLGNIRGKDWRIQTNTCGNGSTGTGREERYGLWFDPAEDFHRYSILWTESHIIFYVDGVPVRVVNRREEMGGDFPSKPMSVYVTIWDGSDWATSGGKYRVNYKYAPFVAEFSNLVLHGCTVDPMEQQLSMNCGDIDVSSKSMPAAAELVEADIDNHNIIISPRQRTQMESFRKKHMTYSYCYDRTRYKVPPPECSISPGEEYHLRKSDPVTFGGNKRRHARRGGRRHRSRTRSPTY
ncbi:hypothetical protein SAY86_008308 [Trapa natans]|uniref:Xyloglucan endotransglucosylase/hydrolase n=1 Tax=Trapa natans TaxID=22666 RepID=A0AAN7K894_TRANT|nr:hypothetical protein SAY86_008308 [Trapa natans]